MEYELLQKLKDAGLNTELAQKITKSKNNSLAKKFVDSVRAESNFLETLGIIMTPSTNEPFVVKNRFIVNADRKALVRISHLEDNFKKWFLDKTEDPVVKTELYYRRLRKDSTNTSIISGVGGRRKVETMLTQVFFLMTIYNTNDKVLCDNGRPNLFYVRDVNDVLRVISVYWAGDGWSVCAHTVSDSINWSSDLQIFYRSS